MSKGFVARASVGIKASIVKVWDALTKPEIIRQYMFGAEVISDWKVGGPIVWKGVWEGKPYEDKGTIMKMECLERLVFTHFSPLSGVPDVPENYHTVTYELSDDGDFTTVSVTQDNNASEELREQSRKNWEGVLSGLKKTLEK